MARFAVRLSTPRGVRDIEIEARDSAAARLAASKHGRVLEVKQRRSFTFGALTFQDRQTLFGRLSTMIASGMGAGASVRLIYETFPGRIKRIAHELLLKMEAGADLGAAIEEIGAPHFPDAVAAMVRAGMHSGSTAVALRDAMNFEREMMAIKKTSSKGVGRAIAGFISAAIFILGIVFYAIPEMEKSQLIRQMGGLSRVQWAVDTTYILGYFMMATTAIAIVFTLLGTVGRFVAPGAADAIIVRVPFYKDLVLARNNFIVFYTLALLRRSGVSLEQCFHLVCRATKPGALKNDLARAERAVKSGKRWAPELSILHPTDRSALETSLDSEQLSRAFDATATFYKDLYAHRIAALVPTLEAISSLLLLASGGLIFAITILPMLQMMEKML